MAAKKPAAARKPASRRALMSDPWAIVESSASTPRELVSALGHLPWSVVAERARYRTILAIALDGSRKADVRSAALSAAHSLTFDAQRFASLRPDYLRALRKLGEDNDLELRQRSLGMLMREGDAQTERKLLLGLTHPQHALLPAAKALQLLAYQLHAESYSAAREIVARGGDALAREAALRLLAADASAGPLFEQVLADRTESSEARGIAATALHQLLPGRLQALARKIAIDTSEDQTLRTTCLTALTHFGDTDAISADAELMGAATRASETDGVAPGLKSAFRGLLGRHGR